MAKYEVLCVTGKTVIINYSKENLEDKCPNVPEDAYETVIGFQTLNVGREISDSELENLDKKKGKYVKEDFFTEILPNQAYLYWAYYDDSEEMSSTYEIELEDDEEFDPKQLQFVKATDIYYEKFKSDDVIAFQSIPPYFIVADYVLYKGKKCQGYLYQAGDPIQERHYFCKVEKK